MTRKLTLAEKRDWRLGKATKKIMERAGITQDRYREVKAWLTNQDIELVTCKCEKREKQLDELGQLAIKAFRFLTG